MEVIRCDLSLRKTLDMTPKLQMKKLKIDVIEFKQSVQVPSVARVCILKLL